jgi:hypothetical protein
MQKRLNPSPLVVNSPAKFSNSAWYSWSSLLVLSHCLQDILVVTKQLTALNDQPKMISTSVAAKSYPALQLDTGYLSCASVNFQEYALQHNSVPVESWVSTPPIIAYFWAASGYKINLLLGFGYMHKIAFATAAFVRSKAFCC